MHHIKKLAEIQEHINDGSIALGMTKNDLKNILGQPTDWGATSRKQKAPLVWKYEDVEFGFSRGSENEQELCMVYVDDGVEALIRVTLQNVVQTPSHFLPLEGIFKGPVIRDIDRLIVPTVDAVHDNEASHRHAGSTAAV